MKWKALFKKCELSCAHQNLRNISLFFYVLYFIKKSNVYPSTSTIFPFVLRFFPLVRLAFQTYCLDSSQFHFKFEYCHYLFSKGGANSIICMINLGILSDQKRRNQEQRWSNLAAIALSVYSISCSTWWYFVLSEICLSLLLMVHFVVHKFPIQDYNSYKPISDPAMSKWLQNDLCFTVIAHLHHTAAYSCHLRKVRSP